MDLGVCGVTFQVLYILVALLNYEAGVGNLPISMILVIILREGRRGLNKEVDAGRGKIRTKRGYY